VLGASAAGGLGVAVGRNRTQLVSDHTDSSQPPNDNNVSL